MKISDFIEMLQDELRLNPHGEVYVDKKDESLASRPRHNMMFSLPEAGNLEVLGIRYTGQAFLIQTK